MSDCVSQDTKWLTRARYLLFPSTRDGTSIYFTLKILISINNFLISINANGVTLKPHFHTWQNFLFIKCWLTLENLHVFSSGLNTVTYFSICLLLILWCDWSDHDHLTTLKIWYWGTILLFNLQTQSSKVHILNSLLDLLKRNRSELKQGTPENFGFL